MNATLAMRRILSLTVLLAMGAAQAMATACPMGIAGGGDYHPVVHFGSTQAASSPAHHRSTHDAPHDGHPAAPPPAHHRVSAGGEAENNSASVASAPLSRAPLDAGVPCALTMSCAPLIPASNVPLGALGWAALLASPSVSKHLHSADMDAITPPPRPLV